MATTEKGVYYQDDYTKIADILADMKKMAESIDKLIEETEYDDKDVKNDIKTIQDEQKVQNKDIENIQTKDTEQDKLIQKLQSNMIDESTEEATSLHVADASDLPAVLTIEGNHYQETQEGTDNLAVLNEGSITQNGITINVENGVVNISGIATADTIIIIGEAYLYAGKTYYLSKDMNGGGYFIRNSQNEQKWFYNGETSVVMKNTGKCDVCVSFAANDTANKAVKLLISETSNANWVQGKKNIPSLEYSSEIETVKDNIKIIQCNSNFLKKQDAVENVTARGLTGQVLEDGTIILNGTTTGATYIQLTDELKIATYTGSQNFEKHILPIGNYKFISETSGQVSANDIHAYLYDVDKESFLRDIIIQKISESSKKETAFEISEKWRYYAYVWIKAGTTLTNFTMKFMLKRADDNSEYVQNEQKEYNLAVQKNMLQNDYFDTEKEIHKWGYINTKNVTNLAVSLNTSNKDFRRYSVDLKINNRKSGEYLKLLCTHFKYTDSRWHEYEGICGWESGQTFCIGTFNKELDTAEKMKNYLLNNDVEIYYELAEQEELDLTEEQKETLAQLDNLDLFKGVNNIYTEQDLALLQLNYVADTKMYIDNKITSQNREG